MNLFGQIQTSLFKNRKLLCSQQNVESKLCLNSLIKVFIFTKFIFVFRILSFLPLIIHEASFATEHENSWFNNIECALQRA